MATIGDLATEIEENRSRVSDIRSKIERGGVVFDRAAAGETVPTDGEFVAENARIEEIVRNHRGMEAALADLVAELDDKTRVITEAIDGRMAFTPMERAVGLVSKRHMRQMQTRRLGEMPVATDVHDLLRHSDAMIGILRTQKTVLDTRFAASEASLVKLIKRHRDTLAGIGTSQVCAGDPVALPATTPGLNDATDTEDQAAPKNGTNPENGRTDTAGVPADPLDDARADAGNEAQTCRRDPIAESRMLERSIAMLQTLVDSLNNQIAAQNVLIDKLSTDVELRIIIHRALLARGDAANGNGDAVAARDAGPPAFAHIGDFVDMYERNMLAIHEVHRRKSITDAAFAERFAAGGNRPDDARRA